MDVWTLKLCDFGISVYRYDNEARGCCVVTFFDAFVTHLPQMFTEKAGTYLWMAPEVFNGTAYDESVDVFSFAVVMWELLTLQRPYPGMKVDVAFAVHSCASVHVWCHTLFASSAQESQVYDHVVVRGNRLAVPARLRVEHPRYCELMEQCWHEDPKQRLTADMLASELEALITMASDISPENSD
jgi:serine/threonine protein kinase